MKKKIIFILPLVVILVLFVYKTSVLLYFRNLTEYSYNLDSVVYKERKVKIDKKSSNITYKNLNLYIPEKFSNISKKDGINYYFLDNENFDNYTTFIMVSKSTFCIESDINEDKRLQTMNYKKLMKNNNITNEFDLIKYYLNNQNINYFSSTNQIKINYLSLKCSFNILGTINNTNYEFLNGDIDGLIDGLYTKEKQSTSFRVYNKNNDEYYSILIFKNKKNKNYYESLNNDDENKIINSIYFN